MKMVAAARRKQDHHETAVTSLVSWSWYTNSAKALKIWRTMAA